MSDLRIQYQLELLKNMKSNLNKVNSQLEDKLLEDYRNYLSRLRKQNLAKEAMENLEDNYYPETKKIIKNTIELVERQINELNKKIDNTEGTIQMMKYN